MQSMFSPWVTPWFSVSYPNFLKLFFYWIYIFFTYFSFIMDVRPYRRTYTFILTANIFFWNGIFLCLKFGHCVWFGTSPWVKKIYCEKLILLFFLGIIILEHLVKYFLAALSSFRSLVVCPLVGPSVRRSVGRSTDVCEKVTFRVSKGN